MSTLKHSPLILPIFAKESVAPPLMSTGPPLTLRAAFAKRSDCRPRFFARFVPFFFMTFPP